MFKVNHFLEKKREVKRLIKNSYYGEPQFSGLIN
jgi:hypothetical protein